MLKSIKGNWGSVPIPQLAHGFDKSRPMERCTMALVAYLAGEEHTDHPSCACPVITKFVIPANDAMDAKTRQRVMGPRVWRISGTRSTREVELARMYIAADFAVREAAPFALRAVGLHEQARRLESVAPIVDRTTAYAAAADAAYAADAAAYADAAAAAARAAYAAAADAAYADAAAAAARAAYAAARAAYAADAAAIWESYAACLDRMIALTEQKPVICEARARELVPA